MNQQAMLFKAFIKMVSAEFSTVSNLFLRYFLRLQKW